jgi:phospholipid transport system substrate-binding protein
MYVRRLLLGAVLCAPVLAAMPVAAQADVVPADAAKAFITQSGQQLVTIVNGTASASQKADQLRQLVQFLTLFHQLLSYNITFQIKAYQGLTFVVNGAVPMGSDMVVHTTIASPGKAPADVGWAVDEVNGQPKIVDVIVAGTSLRITTRNEYASVVTDNGGQVAALLSAMQKQITKISAAQ